MIDKIVAEQTSVTASALSLLTPLALIQPGHPGILYGAGA